jgi:hypothetical protein
MAKKKSFIWALESMQKGKSVKREYWVNGNVTHVHLNEKKDGFIMQMIGNAKIPWIPAGTDMFASDWVEA